MDSWEARWHILKKELQKSIDKMESVFPNTRNESIKALKQPAIDTVKLMQTLEAMDGSVLIYLGENAKV